MGLRNWFREIKTKHAKKKARRHYFKELDYYENSLRTEEKNVINSPKLSASEKKKRLEEIKKEKKRIKELKLKY